MATLLMAAGCVCVATALIFAALCPSNCQGMVEAVAFLSALLIL